MKPDPAIEATDALFCRNAVEIPATSAGEFMFMPAGRHVITPFEGSNGEQVELIVDRQGAAEMEKQRAMLTKQGRRPYFDFEHADSGASFWPSAFFWKDGHAPGIYCKGEWTADGKAGIEGKTWRSFSPVFHVDNKAARPARLVCRDYAKPNMGAIVNDPAFYQISPLWAKNAGGAQSNDLTHHHLNEQQLAALQAKNTELETEIARLKGEQTALKAKSENDEFVSARIEAKQAQLEANAAKLELEGLKAKSAGQEVEILAQREANAEAAVKAAVDRGAIAAKDAETIAAWKKDIAADPGRAALLAKMQGSPALETQRITRSTATVTTESPNNVIKAFGAIVAKNAALPLSHATAGDKGRLAAEAAALFAKDISGNLTIAGMNIDDALKAADYSDAVGGAGLLSGSLVMQQSLTQMSYEYPLLGAITTDFSAEPGEYNQTANTRIVMTPAVQTYSPTLGSDGRPAGWSTASPAQAVDIPVTLDSYYGVPLVFGIGTLAATLRNLFAEQAPLALYALGGAFVNKLTALMTSANFNAYAGTSLTGGATTSGSKNITFDSSAIVYPGQYISGTGIPANTYIASVTSATAAVLTQKATATGSSLTFTVGNSKVPTTYTTYAKALADFSTACYADLKTAFSTHEVPQQNRFALLASSYYGKLSQDPIFNMFAAMKSPELITKGKLPEVQGFTSIDAPYFPTANYGVGFAGHKSALVIKSRLPQQLSQSFAASAPGNISTVTDPITGLSVSLVQFWNLQTNAYEWRPEVMVGASAGDRRCGLLLTSQ